MANIKPPAPPYVGPPRWKGNATNKPIRRIVIHCTAGSEPGVNGAARATAAYTKGTSRPSSWHYCADSRESVQLTWDSVVAYHCGVNSNSIGYELSCSLADGGAGHWDDADHQAMLEIAAEDVARLCLAYDVPIRKLSVAQVRGGDKGLCGHVDIRDAFPGKTTHWDPGPHFPWARFVGMVQAAADRLTVKAPRPTTLVVATWNAHVTNRRQSAGARRLAATVKWWLRMRPDAIGVQEADHLTPGRGAGLWYKVIGYDGADRHARRTPVLVKRWLRVVLRELHEGAPAVSAGGPNKDPRPIYVVGFVKRGARVAVVNTHMHVVPEDRLIGTPQATWPPAARATYAHALKVLDVAHRLRGQGWVVVVTADANTRRWDGRLWEGSLHYLLERDGWRVTANHLDLVASHPSQLRQTRSLTVAKPVTYSDHAAVVVAAEVVP